MIGGKRIDYFRDTLIGRAYIGGAVKVGPINSTSIQLWNPADSGFFLILNKLNSISEAAATVTYTLRYHTVALTGAENQANKYLGGAAGVGLVKSQDLTMAGVGTLIQEFGAPPGIERNFLENSDPMIIGEGLGITITCLNSSAHLSVIFEWIEVAI